MKDNVITLTPRLATSWPQNKRLREALEQAAAAEGQPLPNGWGVLLLQLVDLAADTGREDIEKALRHLIGDLVRKNYGLPPRPKDDDE